MSEKIDMLIKITEVSLKKAMQGTT